MTFERKLSSFQESTNDCTSIKKKARKESFQETTKNGIMTNKELWKLLKVFQRTK